VVLVCMILLVNNKDVMGEHTNNRFQNIFGWTTIAILIALSVTLLVSFFF
jgi:Mn2+/Fe2+ NRAMP family transporter